MIGFDYLLLIGSALIIASIAIAKLSDNLGVPALLLFLAVGMFAGSEGPGGIFFENYSLSRSIGIVALVFILFAGGLDTKWPVIRPVLWQATSLATLGVMLTAVVVGIFSHFALGLTLIEGLLLGAVVSSTDAAAVFSILQSRNISLKGKLKPLLEAESGSNDPMAIFLTVGLIELAINPEKSGWSLIALFAFQMGFGGLLGFGLGKLMVLLLNRMNFSYEGFYPVFSQAFALFIYAVTAVVNGSGFLAVYIAALIVGNSEVVQKRSLFRFFDGLAWLSQISMFLTLGLLVYPSRVVQVVGAGVLLSAFLIFIARPVSVFLSLSMSSLRWREKLLVAWVGIRGAVPIILAIFPLLAGLSSAPFMFNVVFFIVLTSTLLQGWSIPIVARWLSVDAPLETRPRYPLEFEAPKGIDTDMVDFIIPYHSAVSGKSIVELGMPEDSLVVLIIRAEQFIVPSGGTVLEDGDTILVLVNKNNLPEVRKILSEVRKDEQR